jgi:hypothetical protein
MKRTTMIFLILFMCANVHVFSRGNDKKIEFEVSVGVAKGDPESIYQRSAGIDEVISQYTRYYRLNYSSTAGTLKKKSFIPVNLSVSYRLNRQLYLRAGLDYSIYSLNNSALEKTFRVNWDNFYEAYDYNLTDNVSYLMPQVGVGFRHASVDFYGALGIGFARLTHTEELSYSESQPSYSFSTTHTYAVKGSAPGVVIGIKYRLPLFKKSSGRGLSAILKLEAVILKVKEFSGSKTLTGSDSEGERFSEISAGTLYQFQWNPYASQWFDYWELYDAVPSDPSRRNFEKLGINFSGIRLMIGFSF